MRLDPTNYKPILGFHFQVHFGLLSSGGGFVANAKATALPSMDNNPIVMDYGNTYMFVKGKTRWSEITMTFYSLSTPESTKTLWDYLQQHQEIEGGIDTFKGDYMNDIQIKLTNPDETIVGTWKLVNAFMSSMNMGTMDWSSEEVVQPEVTFVYDYATYTAGG